MEGEEEEGEVDIDDDNDGGARKKHVRGHKRKKDVVG